MATEPRQLDRQVARARRDFENGTPLRIRPASAAASLRNSPMSFPVDFAYQRASGPSIPIPMYPFLSRVDVLVSMAFPR